MQNLKLITAIGTVVIRKKNEKVVSLKLPKNPPSSSCILFSKVKEYRYKDLFNLTPDLSTGTAFQQKIWKYIKKIPYGRTVTYKKVTEDLGLDRAYRAVGQACKKNPVPIIIPCHRVISSNNKLGGYSSGLKWKKFLLRLEKGRI